MAKTPKIIIQKATAFQLNPNNSYIIHAPELEHDEMDALNTWLKAQGIKQAAIINTEKLNISEVP